MSIMKRQFGVYAILLCACGASHAFQPTFPDNVSTDVQTVLSRLHAWSPLPLTPTLAAGLSGDNKLFVIDLDASQVLWTTEVRIPVSAPHIAGDYVVLHEARGITIRSILNGNLLSTIGDEALHVAGVGGQGSKVVISLTTGGGIGARSKLIMFDGGEVRWQQSLEFAIGAPTIAANMVFIPWSTQNLSVLEDSNGH